MKKLFILLVFTLLSVVSFGQNIKPEIGMGGVADFFSQKSACEMYNIFEKDKMGDAFLENTFSFKINDKQYLVSYDNRPDNINSALWKDGETVRTRKLYLYYLSDDGWKLALNEPLQNDFKMENGLCSYYFPLFTLDNLKGGAIVQENNILILNIIIIYNNLSSLEKTQYKINKIMLSPIGGGMYEKIW